MLECAVGMSCNPLAALLRGEFIRGTYSVCQENMFSKCCICILFLKPEKRCRPLSVGSALSSVCQNLRGEFDNVIVIRKVVGKLVHKPEERYSEIVSHLRTRLRFVLLRACILDR